MMQTTTAIILAAGQGVRMGRRGELIPKGMIALGGIPLIRASVANLRAAGVGHIRIVTGHLSPIYQSEFAGNDPDIELVYNPDYATTGSLQSLIIGLRGAINPVVLLESDILYERRALTPVLGGKTRTLLSGPTQATDEVYVWADAKPDAPRQLNALSKNKAALTAPPLGEFVGITSISAAALEPLAGMAQKLCRPGQKIDYEDVLVALASQVPFDCHLISDLCWAEIDDEPMLARAKTEIWPKLDALRNYQR